MNRKAYKILIICLVFVISIFLISRNKANNFKVINNTEKSIEFMIIENNDEKMVSLNKLSDMSIPLTKCSDIVILYHYDNGLSSESFVIGNKDEKDNFSRIIINSISNNDKWSDIELK